jgi:hypothetical protein
MNQNRAHCAGRHLTRVHLAFILLARAGCIESLRSLARNALPSGLAMLGSWPSSRS